MERESVFKSLPYFLLLVLLSLLLILTENFTWAKLIRGLAGQGIKPVKLSIYSGQKQLTSGFSFLTFWRFGEQKIKYLEERNRELLVEAQKVRVLEEENRALREQLGISFPSDWQLQTAQVIGKTRYLTIDRGEVEGVKAGQLVIIEKFLVGKVLKVNPHESQVELPSDPESKIPVQTAKTRARGLLIGQFGKGMNVEKVTQGELLEKEDSVLTTGEEGYLKGLIIGKIGWIEKKESDLFQKAGVDASLNFDELETVFLVKI